MRLMHRFKQQLQQLGALRRVWLTSFNIDIPFIESHILPAVLGEDPPRDRMAYEALQYELAERDIDFRVFCEKRALKTNQPKRTAIRIMPVDVRNFAQDQRLAITERSLFHPKVIYLEGQDGRVVLGAGSANLTLSGWGRNREVFDFRPVSSEAQWQQVRSFFLGLDGALPLPEHLSKYGGDTGWQFVHSFAQQTFLQALAGDAPIERLTVWSPYLAENVPAFIDRLQQKMASPGLHVALVPDRIDGYRIRTRWSSKISELVANGTLSFHDYPAPVPENIEFTHAKLWLAEHSKRSTLAFGSWNFTHPGSSSFIDPEEDGGGTNIEAGMLLDGDTSLVLAGAPLTVDQDAFATQEELEEEALDVDNTAPLDLMVVFNWQTATFTISGHRYDDTPAQDYRIKLPGIGKRIKLQWQDDTLLPVQQPAENSAAVLSNHFFSVESGKVEIYRGLIIEIGQGYRRSQGFETLKDLFDSLVANTDPETNSKVVLHPILRDMELTSEEPLQSLEPDAPEELSYFRLFFAMKQFRQRLEKSENYDQLHKSLLVLPGCLQELAGKVREEIEGQPFEVLHWFMAQEVNTSCHLAQRLCQAFGSAAVLTEHQWASMQVEVPRLRTRDKRTREFLGYVADVSGYKEKSHA
ncbi:hypothetical protein KUV95_12470 [Microbulbifer agarilyticus]|uniref:hypothetical protein n=1 Tax=Microbulbifer agarilyticus TaxID=260552 RepID=UPI001C96F8E2|nr:hypothetical protein [Microbulbifer agarilyticus]MBY6212365.1 hypothetical protein [Microbulbifer agarilyticus]